MYLFVCDAWVFVCISIFYLIASVQSSEVSLASTEYKNCNLSYDYRQLFGKMRLALSLLANL